MAGRKKKHEKRIPLIWDLKKEEHNTIPKKKKDGEGTRKRNYFQSRGPCLQEKLEELRTGKKGGGGAGMEAEHFLRGKGRRDGGGKGR